MIVEDERVLAADLEDRLVGMDYGVCGIASSGERALDLAKEACPDLDLVIMDIKLDGAMDGVEAAGLIRERHGVPVIYLTAFSDDYVLDRAKTTEPFGYLIKPFQSRELRSTIEIALYKAAMEEELRRTKAELEESIAKVKVLSGLLPICAQCKKIRDDKGYWNHLESYICEHSDAEFSHGICPDCVRELYPELKIRD